MRLLAACCSFSRSLSPVQAFTNITTVGVFPFSVLVLCLFRFPLLDHLYPLVLDFLHHFHHQRMIELALRRVEKLLVRARAIVALLILERLHHQVEAVQVLDKLSLGGLGLFVFLQWT